jgi:glycosyltransferase involved in cell wall biosynthesis
MMGVPFVLHLMDKIPNQVYELPQLKCLLPFKHSRGKTEIDGSVIACSKALLREVLDDGFRFSDDNVVPNWVDVEVSDGFKSVYAPADVLRICFAGTICEEKGVAHIIAGLGLLSAEEHRAVRVDLYGQGSAGRFLQMARELGVDDVIVFKGAVNRLDLIDAYRSYHLFLFRPGRGSLLRSRRWRPPVRGACSPSAMTVETPSGLRTGSTASSSSGVLRESHVCCERSFVAISFWLQ